MISQNKNETDELLPAPVNASDEVVLPLASIQLQPDAELPSATSHSVDELLRYHDRAFVERLYAVIAGRKPSERELAPTLADLRNGVRTKLEIIETVAAEYPEVKLEGMPSGILRSIGRWPVVGYFLRVLRGLSRLPLMMQDQQRFETYSLAQQQRIADYLNEKVIPALNQRVEVQADAQLRNTLADAVESVVMLSESLIELSARQITLEEEVQLRSAVLQKLEERLELLEPQLGLLAQQQEDFWTRQRALIAQQETLAKQPAKVHEQILEIQTQREESELRLHNDVLRLTEALTTQQEHVEALMNEANENAAAQREFLLQEQRLIVEAQKVVLKGLEEQLNTITKSHDERLQELSNAVAEQRQRTKPIATSARQRTTVGNPKNS